MQIIKAEPKHLKALTALASKTFVASHETSASKVDIETYVNEHYTEKALKKDMEDVLNTYRLIYWRGQLAGFSKIICNKEHEKITAKKVAKFDRIYILEQFHRKGLGYTLFEHNVELAKANGQEGIWLHTWTGNLRAVRFYKKLGFEVVGSHDFKISEQHSNPNYLMFLNFNNNR
ncbi:MAG: GNAT family N-acetyltransferase [Crocinitomicaceae bacterium]